MSLDVYNLTPKELTQLNSSMVKYKENCLLKLHNLQRVNHNLIIENTKLRQTLKYGSRERESLLVGFRNQNDQNRVKTMDVTVETQEDNTAMVYFKCLLDPSEISNYFNCDFSELQHKVVLVEWNGNVVENASTIVTKQNQLKLKMLQYLVTVHLYGNNKKLSGQTEFVYTQKYNEDWENPLNLKDIYNSLKKIEPVKDSTGEKGECEELEQETTFRQETKRDSEFDTKEMEYTLNLQVDDDYYISCKFTENETLEEVVDKFMEKNKLKGFLRESLVKCVTELKSSGDSVETVDVTDLI